VNERTNDGESAQGSAPVRVLLLEDDVDLRARFADILRNWTGGDLGSMALAAGVVLTGGSSKMEGAVELAEEVFHMPVRLGVPQHIMGLVDVVSNPIHSTGVGLLLYGRENFLRGRRESPSPATCAACGIG